MTRFENKLCPVCRRPFTENDDIVVCPVCGTPHHRACYNEKGGCGVEEWHASGFVWEGHLPGEEPEPSNGQEEQSGVDLSKHDDTGGQSGDYSDHRAEYPGGVPNGSFNACGPDGQPVDIQEFLDQINRQTMDDTRGEDGVSAKELSCYVGKSVMHYSQAFAAFRAPAAPGQKKRKVFFNLCAGLFTPVHQFYRKLDAAGVILVLLELAYYVPTLLSFAGSFSASVVGAWQFAASGLYFAAKIALCMFGDYIYYRHCVKRIKQIRANYDDGNAPGYYEALNAKGSPSWLRAIISILAVYLLQAILLLYFVRMNSGMTGTMI